jgi:hypothetical protein
MPEKPTRVGDLIKAKAILREDVVAAIATVFDGKSTLPLPGGAYACPAGYREDDALHAGNDHDGADRGEAGERVSARPLATVTVEEMEVGAFILLRTDRGGQIRTDLSRRKGLSRQLCTLARRSPWRRCAVLRGADFGAQLADRP